MFNVFFKKKPQESYGVDLGSRWIKAVGLKRTKEGLTLLLNERKELPEEAVVEREVLDRISVTDRLKELALATGLDGQDVVIGVSRGVILRHITVPQGPKDREQVIENAARQNIPFDLNDVIWDYRLLHEDEHQLTLFLAAARQEVVWSILELFRSANMNPVKIVPQSLAWSYVLEEFQKESDCLILDVGEVFTDIIHMQEGKPVNSRDVVFGIRNYLDAMRRELGFSYNKGREILFSSQRPDDIALNTVIDAETALFLDQLERVTSFFWTSEEEKPKVIYLTGGGARVPALRAVLEERFHIATEILDPIQDSGETESNEGTLYGVAYGLALAGLDPEGINLLPEEELPVERESIFSKIALPFYTALFSAVVVMLLLANSRARLASLQADLSALQAEEAILRSKASMISDIMAREKQINARSKIIQNLVKDRTFYVSFLDELNYLLPSDIWLESIVEMSNQSEASPRGSTPFKLRGIGKDTESVSTFLRILENSGSFSRVVLSYMKKEVMNGASAAVFEILLYPRPH